MIRKPKWYCCNLSLNSNSIQITDNYNEWTDKCFLRAWILFGLKPHRWHSSGVLRSSFTTLAGSFIIFPTNQMRRTSSINRFPSSNVHETCLFICLVLPSCAMNSGVLNEFQCLIVFKDGEMKSVEMTCIWRCCMLGSAWKPILNWCNFRFSILITSLAILYISFNSFKWFFVNYKEVIAKFIDTSIKISIKSTANIKNTWNIIFRKDQIMKFCLCISVSNHNDIVIVKNPFRW